MHEMACTVQMGWTAEAQAASLEMASKAEVQSRC